jgi:hypothetical protein
VVQLHADLRRESWDLILYADGDDAFLTRSPWEATRALWAYGADFVVSAEFLCWPWPGRDAHRYPPDGAPCRFPNAGVWVATRAAWEAEFSALVGIAESGDSYREGGMGIADNDQQLFHERLLSGRSRMAVDTRGLLCLNLNAHPEPAAALRRRVLLDEGPPVVHGSGAAKAAARQLWVELAQLRELQGEARYDGPGRDTPGDPALREVDWANNHVGGLLELARALPPLRRVAEVGCWRGVSTEVWALFADKVWAVDAWWDGSACADFLRRMAPYPHVQAVRGESTTAARAFPDRHFDLVYIDADHGYEAVKADLRAWLPKVRAGGWIAGHDYTELWGCGGVIRAVNEVLGGPDQVVGDFSWLALKPG